MVVPYHPPPGLLAYRTVSSGCCLPKCNCCRVTFEFRGNFLTLILRVSPGCRMIPSTFPLANGSSTFSALDTQPLRAPHHHHHHCGHNAVGRTESHFPASGYLTSSTSIWRDASMRSRSSMISFSVAGTDTEPPASYLAAHLQELLSGGCVTTPRFRPPPRLACAVQEGRF